MKATETRIEDFLSSNKTQFIIPVYQRNYDWIKSQCKQLLNDILQVGSNQEMSAHFIGSIVYVHDDVYTTSNVKELTVIDGQQRLTTITILYIVIYRLANEMGVQELVEEIFDTYLINKYVKDEEKLKLRPTENNSKSLKFLLDNETTETYKEFSRIIDNYNYFKSRITSENYKIVLKGLSKLMFVEISLDRRNDDPQRIFESLNSTGLELSQADLIRNFILMGLNRNEQINVYQKYWEIIEQMAKDEKQNVNKVSDFIRDYLTLKNKKIPNKNQVYNEFKMIYPVESLSEQENILAEIKNLSKNYNKLLNPKNEIDPEIRLQLQYINRLEINVAFPFLLQVYEDYLLSLLNKQTFIEILELIQSFTWRRFIMGLPTNALNKIFMNLYEKIDTNNYLASIQISLVQRSGSQRFPKNGEIIDTLKIKDVYNVQPKNRMYFLERLENYQNNERVFIEGNPNITIEHIFPQNPDIRWKSDLNEEEFLLIKENYLNTISNLTLSGNNGKLGNKTFLEKRDMVEVGYNDSRLWLNRYLSQIEKWNYENIQNRCKLITERFLKIWKYPNVSVDSSYVNGEINIFEADEPRFKKLEYAVFFDKKIEVTQVSRLYVEVLRQLFEFQPETFFNTDLAEKLNLTKEPQLNGLRQPVKLNETYFVESNIDSNSKFDRLKHALDIFNFEDELFIKYSES